MKFLSFATTVFLIGPYTFADCFPPAWKLPNKGNGCELLASFGSQNQVWSCSEENSKNSLWLLSGETTTQSEGDICFVITSVVKQNPKNNN